MNQHAQSLRYSLQFTRVYQACAGEPAAVREARCLAEMLPHVLLPIRETDGFAGRIRMSPVGFSPEPGGLGYYCNEEEVRRDLALQGDTGPGEKEILEMLDFWRTEQTSFKVRATRKQALMKRFFPAHWLPSICCPKSVNVMRMNPSRWPGTSCSLQKPAPDCMLSRQHWETSRRVHRKP